MPQIELSKEKLNSGIVNILLETSIVSSKTEEDLSNNFIIIQKGKKIFLKVIFK